ncbi:Periplasmic chaperone PpiD [Buchnera aphidicola (Eriosoma grossulariae)]|uniref:SurA N-terminal domain-containing protein n=1 Tax=Buchnera aphidicola TaxID=9 RepID=UPI0034640225
MIKYFNIFSKKIILKIILIIILISIICNNIKNYQYKTTKIYAAKVNNEIISYQQIKYIYMLTEKQQKKELGRGFSKIINTKKNQEITYNTILKNMINEIILKQYAIKLGFDISNKDIKKIISKIPYFQKNNKFNYNLYLEKLKNIGTNSYEYENNLKQYKIKEQIMQKITDSDFTLKHENNFFIKLLSEKRMIKNIHIKMKNLFKKQKINNQKCYEYFQKYSNLFILPEKFKIDYIKIKMNKIPIHVNNIEIKNWYFKNIKKYINPESKKYSMIQTNSLEESQKILSYLKKNKKFFYLAKKYSIDPISSISGGNIGWIKINHETPEIKKIKLNKINQISPIIKSKIGYLIFQLNQIHSSSIKPLSEVKNTIFKIIKRKKQILKKQYIKKLINHDHYKKLEKISKKIYTNTRINNIQTNWFSKDFNVYNNEKKDIIQYIFNTKKDKNKNNINQNIQLININDNIIYLIKIQKYIQKQKIKFKNVKNDIQSILQYQKNRKEIFKISKKIILEINKNERKTIKKYQLIVEKPIIIHRNNQNDLSNLVFKLNYPHQEKKIFTLKEKKNGDVVIISLYKIINNNINSQEKKMITSYLNQYQKTIILKNFLLNLKKTSDIKYGNQKFFK